MPSRLPSPGSFALVVALASLAGCTQNDDPEGASRLYAKINEGEGFRTWRRAPGFATRQPSFTAHSDAVEVFVNAEVAAALDGPTPILTWPEGALIVKEGFSGDARSLVAVMEKRAGRWYWAEYDGDGNALYSGEPKVCVGCHDKRQSYSDWVYSFELPR
ncbi:MAG: cytochrome P460 family protein [Labilithrix sp.]|nr:cytochrome P460 family protein [Labilithrix sp.]MBX3225191.1 cytochrome P460 family protein [Labilithrix sp.]